MKLFRFLRGIPRVLFLLFLLLPIFVSLSRPSVESTTMLSILQATNEVPSVDFSINSFGLPEKVGGKDYISIHVALPVTNHIYLDKGESGLFIPLSFDFTALNEAGYEVLPFSSPDGEYDGGIGATVLSGGNDFIFSVTKKRDGRGSPADIKVRYQICNDLSKICYPPVFADIDLSPYYSNVALSDVGDKVGSSLSERINSLYESHSGNFFYALMLMFAAGIFSAATPCVYPMIPITSAILLKRGGGNKGGHLHTLAYFMGIVLSYAILGYAAGMTGGAFSVIMRSPVANLFLALLFFIFAFSMFDIFDLPGIDVIAELPLAKIAAERGGVAVTLLMGGVAGLVISPCVAPVVFTLLLRVADRIAEANRLVAGMGMALSFWQSSYIALSGAALMAGFGLGIGLPFLLTGLFSGRLPKAGGWMVYVKYLLGILILYVADIYYLKWMTLAAVKPHAGYLILLLVIVFSFLFRFGIIYLKKCKVRSALAFIILGIGLMVVYGGYKRRGEAIYAAPNSHDSMIETDAGGLEWYRDFESAKRVALKERKPIFVDFYADWCANCVEFGKLIGKNEILNRALKKAVLVKTYDTDPIFERFKNNPAHPELKIGLPYFAIFTHEGRLYWKGTEYSAVDTFSRVIEEALKL